MSQKREMARNGWRPHQERPRISRTTIEIRIAIGTWGIPNCRDKGILGFSRMADIRDYEDIEEWSWVDDEFTYEDGTGINLVASVSAQNSDLCQHYSLRDALKSCKNVFEIACDDKDADYFFEFGEDMSVHHLIDAVPRSPKSLQGLYDYVKYSGVTTDRFYNLARQVPGKQVKSLKGCPRIRIHEYKRHSKFGGFSKDKVMEIAEYMEEYGPALGYFSCPPNLEEHLPRQFIYKSEANTIQTKGADGIFRSKSHAVLITGFGRARRVTTRELNYYWKIQNNWGDSCPIARIPVADFAEIYTLKFRNAVKLSSSSRLEMRAEDKGIRFQFFEDYTCN